MVEHSLRMRGARGSIPLISIKVFFNKKKKRINNNIIINITKIWVIRIYIYCKAFVPEWSKGADLSSAIVRCVGSNPTGCIF